VLLPTWERAFQQHGPNWGPTANTPIGDDDDEAAPTRRTANNGRTAGRWLRAEANDVPTQATTSITGDAVSGSVAATARQDAMEFDAIDADNDHMLDYKEFCALVRQRELPDLT
jgi:hypothetical protein